MVYQRNIIHIIFRLTFNILIVQVGSKIPRQFFKINNAEVHNPECLVARGLYAVWWHLIFSV
jgi:hypothetical protein